MRFSFNWLKKYLETEQSIAQVAESLTAIGLEVEDLLDPEIAFKNFKLVSIEKAERHPNADRLQICSVVDGEGNRYQIVCGAPNAREGLIAILAMPGAIIPASNEILKKSKIRGVESQGMMCSFDELAIETEDECDGIIEVTEGTDLKTSVADVLGFDGGIFDVSVTPNRGDCFSVKGIARDLAAYGVGKFIESQPKPCEGDPEISTNVDYEDETIFNYAPQMSFRVICGLKNEESPKWLKDALKNAGLNSISSIVDIANYCMIDCGAPFQIYDLDKIEGSLNIRFSYKNERFSDFKGEQHTLNSSILISEDDSHEPLCLLGIKGGSKVACDENTKNILIESAYFKSECIARTGIYLDATSDSRTRFERGIDCGGCTDALEQVSRMILEICGGTAGKIFTIGRVDHPKVSVQLTKQKLKSVSGCDIEWSKVKEILEKLGLTMVSEDSISATFTVPSWRHDLEIEEDLIEEVLRINGYNNVQEQPLSMISVGEDLCLKDFYQLSNLRKLLASRNMSEAVAYSFTKREFAEAFRKNRKLIFIMNAITTDFEVMRPSLLPNLLKTAVLSLNYGERSASIFEVGHVFADSCVQETNVSGIRIGAANSRNWLNKKRSYDVYDVKSDFFSMLNFYGVNIKNVKIKTDTPSYYHPSRSGAVYFGKKLLGWFGELHPKINKLFGISERIMAFEMLPAINEVKKKRQREYNCKIFPKIERDFSFIFNGQDAVGEIVNNVYKLDNRIAKVDIFDSFRISSTQKSIGITVVLDAVSRTLTENEANEVSDKVVSYVENLGGKLRNQ
ncbi:MAG: phenylalanine--tRNA ligase subunit beta [Alphaproteobacteria bacterium]|nr:phenylalanine--tRNA ligase subunit beta [Alphaproteobacteria bacterium]